MYDFKPDAPLAAEELYRELLGAADALTAGEPDAVANMANVAALLWEFLPDLNWAGFYRVAPTRDGAASELVLGPFVGRPACIRIPFGVGVCGTAAKSRAAQLVEDVHAFPGHIACDSRSASEIVVPVLDASGGLIAVFDVDATTPAAFDAVDQAGLERLLAKVFAAG
jgi:GAF domain-containing protein